ncbi:hypothetical protein JTB14_026677 [Gonioctena quinquepunctata]|nr:hypothetical protein JTB14_026677 [Gonioctena quinquepunctata]
MQLNDTTLICSDSLSAIQALGDVYSRDPMIKQVLALMDWLRQQNKHICLIWIPGHVGIYGNELADQAARNAASMDIPDDIPVRHDDLKVYIKKRIIREWQYDWSSSEAKLKEVKPLVTKWQYPKHLSRREQVVITRLRIGHANLTSMFMLRGEPQPRCEFCRAARLTVKHIVIECPQYNEIRHQLTFSANLRICLSNNNKEIDKIIEFLKKKRATGKDLKII